MRSVFGRLAAVFLATTATAVGAASTGAPPAQAAGPRTGAVYVALGDSYASGEGLGEFEDGTGSDGRYNPNGRPNTNPQKNTCRRSKTGAYGSIVARPIVLPEIPLSSRSFWACSGAWATSMRQSGNAFDIAHEHYQNGQPSQTATVGITTRYVSISAGGNDAGFGAIGKSCASVMRNGVISDPYRKEKTCGAQLDESTGRLAGIRQDLAVLYREVLTNAPSAVLAVVGYPKVVPDKDSGYPRAVSARDGTEFCQTNALGPLRIGLTVADAMRVDAFIRDLNATALGAIADVTAAAGFAGRITFVDTYAPAKPHDCSGSTSGVTVNGIVASPGGNGSDDNKFLSTATFHPTRSGQRMFAQKVQEAFSAFALGLETSRLRIQATPGEAMRATIALRGGFPEFTLTTVSADHPSWLRVGIQGRTVVLEGTPPTAGTWALTGSVTDTAFGRTGFSATITSRLDATALEGKIIRRSDGVSWVVLGGVRRHLPDHPTDLCAQFREGRPVARTGLDAATAATIREGSAYRCSLDRAVLRATDKPDPTPAYWYRAGRRHWIPDAWTYDWVLANGGFVVDVPSEAAILGLPDGGVETPRLRPEAVPRNSIVRRNDGVSWVVDASGVRHHIPFVQDDVCWRLKRALPVSATGLTAGQADALPEADRWPCIIGNAVVRSSNVRCTSSTRPTPGGGSRTARPWPPSPGCIPISGPGPPVT